MGTPWRGSWRGWMAVLALWAVATIASAQSIVLPPVAAMSAAAASAGAAVPAPSSEPLVAKPLLSAALAAAAAPPSAAQAAREAFDPVGYRAPSLSLSRLAQGDPVPARVLAGEFDGRFEAVSGNLVWGSKGEPRWWRIVVNQDVDPAVAPQLTIDRPSRREIELWRPGDELPLRRSIYGPDIDLNHSTRMIVFPLPKGLRKGDALYLRMLAADVLSSQVEVEPLAKVQREDMMHVGLRSVVLTAMGVVAVLAFGFWIGLRERGYAYLGLTLILQILTLTSDGGEMRVVPWLKDIAPDTRTNIVLTTAAVLASIRFLIFFLGLRTTQPRVTRALDWCSYSLGALIVVSLFRTWKYSALYGNLNLLLVLALILYATVVAVWRRQREAYFLLLAWLPLMVLLVILVGANHEWWPEFAWLEYTFPVGLAFGGLGLLLGLTSKLQQLRRDRDTANRLATYDSLTGAMTRAAISQSLRSAVESAHRSQRPLSVVFFDIDHFKRINDEHGHRVGDETLRIVALRTRNRLRAYDLFGRYGGDEVLVVLADTYLRDAARVAEHLRESVSGSPLSIDGRLLPVSLSLGVAELQPGETPEQLLERADAALYASKSAGRDRVTAHGSESEHEVVS
ncbi:sensor domain-containing diguanylate cyclase [Lysobacter enzymogenes]|nr:GGDEF domain-containing protein [Lysobacter enzymogenes]QCW25834.1 diguanylate cyclase [Lysobacter enzymogenes]QQP99621.1 diguanylate cyclase [Lysobacter enzymogenes]UZW59059.1 GGDEF domain-containing protein [Lysobacter enzymogenes]